MGICGHGFIFKEKYSTCMPQGVFTIVGKILTFYKKNRHQTLLFTCACTFCNFYIYKHCKQGGELIVYRLIFFLI